MSSHDPKVLYVAANKVFRSADRGLSWTVISPDLTGNAKRDDIVTMGVKNSGIRISRNDGISSWPCIVTLAESEKRPGLIYAGSEDGRLSVTRDGGKSWTDVFGNLTGALLGGIVLGMLETFAGSYMGVFTMGAAGTEYKDIFAFAILILMLLLRPRGLFGGAGFSRA